MSFHEKSAWACLASILLVFVPYFVIAFSNPGYPMVVPAFLGAVVVLIVILTIVHIFFAVSSARIRRTGDIQPPDERETGIELRSTKIASYVLATVVVTWCLAAYAGILIFRVKPLPAHAALLFVHVLFAGFAFANVVYYAVLVFGYRRSA